MKKDKASKKKLESKIVSKVIAETPIKKEASQKDIFSDMIKAAVKAVIEETLPAMAAASAVANKGGTVAAENVIKRWQICSTCRQKGPPTKANPLGYPCKGNHTYMVVYPQRFQHFAKFFQGVTVNGVRYISSNRRERILVPTEMEGTIMKIVTDWEDNEQATMSGARQAEHDSGDIREVGRNNINPAQQAFR